MTESFGANETPNRNDCNEPVSDYLLRAANACEEGDLVLGMHLYLAAYEQAISNPNVPNSAAVAGLREAWNLACDLKERSMAEYVFEKLEPYLTGEEIADCATKLQDLALDRLEEYGFSREELEDMAEMISQDFMGGDGSVVKVESISIPNMGMFGVPDYQLEAQAETAEVAVPTGAEDAEERVGTGDMQPRADVLQASARSSSHVAPSDADDDFIERPARREDASHTNLNIADADDFNPYDEYRDYSIGKSYHAATNEGSGAAVFTRDVERAQAHERFVESQKLAANAAAEDAAETDGEAREAAASAHSVADAGASSANDSRESSMAPGKLDATPATYGAHSASVGVEKPAGKQIAKPAPGKLSANSKTAKDRDASQPMQLNYSSLVGYDDTISIMRDFGVGMQNDPGYLEFVAMLNERHGLDRAPALDTVLFRAPIAEDALRFVEATAGEIGLPTLRMSMEEGVQGMPVLCVMVQGNHRPRMNHAQNRFEGPAILVIEDLDSWSMPAPPENAEGVAGFVMANISRGAREAVNLIRSAVEDPDVFVLATASTTGEVDPFFYDILEPMTVVDIGLPSAAERADIWMEIARDHPSMRMVKRDDLVRLSAGLPRYDMYMAARDAIEEAYKTGLAQRAFVSVTPQNIFEKLAACQPLDSEEYLALEDEVVRHFREDLDKLEELIDRPGE